MSGDFRRAILGHRVHAQELDRPPSHRALTDAAILDLGVQDTGRDGASWALANRGVRVAHSDTMGDADLVLLWTLRGAPHFYRRSEVLDVLAAVSPYDEADAAKRIFDGSRPFKDAGISVGDALGVVARAQRDLVRRPTPKGELSTALTGRLDAPYLRECRVCEATHPYEQVFRLSAFFGGLELEPGTSPPVLRRIPDWPRRRACPADPRRAPDHLQPIRRYLELFGPAAPKDVAAFLDAPLAVVKAHWPEDAEPVEIDGGTAGQLGELAEPEGDVVRLLGPFDLFLQGRDRELLVPDAAHRKALWPVIGRPGAILSGVELVGTWRPRASGGTLRIELDPWVRLTKTVRGRIEAEAERLAAHRGVRLAGVR